MTTLVTGGAGFLGSHVARHLITSGHEVVILDDLSGGYAENVPSGALLATGSITDRQLVAQLFEEHSFRYVFHLAAYAAEGLSHFIRGFNYTNNVIGSVNLINAAVRGAVERFVFTSSIAVYGAGQLPMDEAMTPEPEDPYGIAKYAVELDLEAANRMFGLDYTVFRPHNVYGEHQNISDKYRNVVGIFMNQIMQGRPMTIFGDGHQTRAFSYIDDVAPIMAKSVAVAGARNEVFNVGADTPYSVLRLAHMVAHAFGVEPEIEHLPERQEVVHAYSSHDRLREVFGEKQPTTLEVGVGRMADWARTVGPRMPTEFGELEVRENLPPSWEIVEGAELDRT